MLAVLLLMVSLSVIAEPVTIRADFGDFSGDTDYGGGDDWGSDSDWGSSWDDDDDDDYYYSGSSSDDSEVSWPMTIFVTIIIIIILVGKNGKGGGKKGGGRGNGPRPAGASETPDSSLTPVTKYKELDPNFNEAEFKENLSNLFVKMQEEWQNRDIESVKPYMTDAFWNQMDRQLDRKRKNHTTPYTERIAVLEVTPRGYYQSNGLDHMIVRLRARFVSYEVEDATGKVISGDKNREKFMVYEWDLCRKSGVITEKAGEMRNVACPNCGAPLNINQTARCPYCDSVVTVVNEDWALDSIKGISQRTG